MPRNQGEQQRLQQAKKLKYQVLPVRLTRYILQQEDLEAFLRAEYGNDVDFNVQVGSFLCFLVCPRYLQRYRLSW